jgi:hypothetical protein
MTDRSRGSLRRGLQALDGRANDAPFARIELNEKPNLLEKLEGISFSSNSRRSCDMCRRLRT